MLLPLLGWNRIVLGLRVEQVLFLFTFNSFGICYGRPIIEWENVFQKHFKYLIWVLVCL